MTLDSVNFFLCGVSLVVIWKDELECDVILVEDFLKAAGHLLSLT